MRLCAALLTASLLIGGFAACGSGDEEAAYEDQQLCLNQADRAYQRVTGSGALLFLGSDEYYRASKDCHDGDFSGPSAQLVRAARVAQARQLADEQRQQEVAAQAARENKELAQAEQALDDEWDRLGCGDMGPPLSHLDQARCDELASATP